MRAILTKYIPATKSTPARVKVSSKVLGSIYYLYDISLADGKAHRKAAKAYACEHDLLGNLIGGTLEDGYVFVFENSLI